MQLYQKFGQHKGSVILEFIIGATVIMLIILGLIQMVLLYQGTIMLQQASFEAARAGIVRHGTQASIRTGFIQNSLDLHGGGQTSSELAASYVRAVTATRIPLAVGGAGFKLRILNPTREAFRDWGEYNQENKRIIRNNWLGLQPKTIGATSGVTRQDAHLLKIEITYGLPLYVPIIDRLLSASLQQLDPDNRAYYRATPVRIPIRSTVTMHMQSDALLDGQLSLAEIR